MVVISLKKQWSYKTVYNNSVTMETDHLKYNGQIKLHNNSGTDHFKIFYQIN